MPHDPYKALYIHIPFCVKKCKYCDFDSSAINANSPEIDAYVEDLVCQIRRVSKQGELAAIETVYLGGGTPSYIGSRRLSSLLYALSHFMRLEPDMECTMEANPESINQRLVNDVWALGVNRISLGVQSFDDAVLTLLGRAHSANVAREAIRIAKSRFSNISVDLMCGIPGQSLASFSHSVNEAIRLGVTHISIYPLTIEPGTAFFHDVVKGVLDEPDEDLQAQCMLRAEQQLEAAGFKRYEVASYAQPGFECKHNIAYWTGVSYLGLGRSAATMTQNSTRRMRKKDTLITDDLNAAQMRAEDLMLAMRMACGVSIATVEQSKVLLPKVGEVFDDLCRLGLCKQESNRYMPTQKGWLCGNELYGRIFDLAP